jgi:hypothetical protein
LPHGVDRAFAAIELSTHPEVRYAILPIAPGALERRPCALPVNELTFATAGTTPVRSVIAELEASMILSSDALPNSRQHRIIINIASLQPLQLDIN